MANERGKAIDNTHLSIDQAEERGFIHRDYIAHCLRWTHVAKYVAQSGRYKTSRVLDIGCGVDLPLARLLYSSRLIVEEYVGVDYNDPKKFKMEPFHTGKMPVKAFGNTDVAKHIQFTSNSDGTPADGEAVNGYSIGGTVHKLPTIVSSFEVLEHIEPGHCRAMLKLIYDMLLYSSREGNDAKAFLSTPCYDANTGAAANHVSEITYQAFGAVLEDLGFEIEGHWGTFASQKDYKPLMNASQSAVFEELGKYYDSNYLATIFAPMFPQASRNVLWQVKIPGKDYKGRLFPPLGDVKGPWTSSAKWEDLDNDDAY